MAQQRGPLGHKRIHIMSVLVCAALRGRVLRAIKTYSGRDKFLDTPAHPVYTPLLTDLSTTCGVILIREANMLIM